MVLTRRPLWHTLCPILSRYYRDCWRADGCARVEKSSVRNAFTVRRALSRKVRRHRNSTRRYRRANAQITIAIAGLRLITATLRGELQTRTRWKEPILAVEGAISLSHRGRKPQVWTTPRAGMFFLRDCVKRCVCIPCNSVLLFEENLRLSLFNFFDINPCCFLDFYT